MLSLTLVGLFGVLRELRNVWLGLFVRISIAKLVLSDVGTERLFASVADHVSD